MSSDHSKPRATLNSNNAFSMNTRSFQDRRFPIDRVPKYVPPIKSYAPCTNILSSWRDPPQVVDDKTQTEDWEIQRRKQSGKKSIAQLKPYREFGGKNRTGVYHDSWLRPGPITPPEAKSRRWLAFNKVIKDLKSVDDYAEESTMIDKKGDTSDLPKSTTITYCAPKPDLKPLTCSKTFTTLNSNMDFDPFGELPGDKEKKKKTRKKDITISPAAYMESLNNNATGLLRSKIMKRPRLTSTVFDPGFHHVDSRDEIDLFEDNYDIHCRGYCVRGARFYYGRVPARVNDGGYQMISHWPSDDAQMELVCHICDSLAKMNWKEMDIEVGELTKNLDLALPLADDERDYLVKLVQLDRTIKICSIVDFSKCPFGGDRLDVLNRRFLEALHNYYIAMGLNMGRIQPQPGYPWLHSAYTEHMNLLNAGLQSLEFSPQNPNKDGCQGSPSPADGGHSAGKCQALDKTNFYMYSPGLEIFSRKVFVGGVPSDIDEDAVLVAFRNFGKLSADWPNRSEFRNIGNRNKSRPGYVFIVYEKEQSVHALRNACIVEDDQYFMQVMNTQQQPKLVQVRPWMLAEANYVVQPFMHVNLRSAIFIGGVPRPIRAVELAHMIDELYGNVVMAGIDTDLPLKYPKGAGRVVFSDFNSYMRAITDKYVRLQHGDIDKVVEIKPYVLDDQPCDECRGQLTDERAAPFFCPHPECLQYYCESCWGILHRSDHRADHRPLIKEA
ncbi:unnamed protein product [Bursaphelenchus okinawaensis]|uniref:Cytoplasmic polyadenylation element-binding protein 1 n=1 Tax=Bursaphelenchus okinawaensis TaxID=465554 RepID=A0A811L4X6_9BILA|nr:unnamed protein product [Bursaphelenchus okinawaensis]CAG9116784.1 unnamed protein product [Bursaphelenchus okinawaensis]